MHSWCSKSRRLWRKREVHVRGGDFQRVCDVEFSEVVVWPPLGALSDTGGKNSALGECHFKYLGIGVFENKEKIYFHNRRFFFFPFELLLYRQPLRMVAGHALLHFRHDFSSVL